MVLRFKVGEEAYGLSLLTSSHSHHLRAPGPPQRKIPLTTIIVTINQHHGWTIPKFSASRKEKFNHVPLGPAV